MERQEPPDSEYSRGPTYWDSSPVASTRTPTRISQAFPDEDASVHGESSVAGSSTRSSGIRSSVKNFLRRPSKSTRSTGEAAGSSTSRRFSLWRTRTGSRQAESAYAVENFDGTPLQSPKTKPSQTKSEVDSEAESELEPVPVSTVSLANFRSSAVPYRIFWPSDPTTSGMQAEDQARYLIKPGERPPEALMSLKQTLVKRAVGRRSDVFAAVAETEDGRSEHVAVKTSIHRRNRLEGAKAEYELLSGLNHSHIIAALDMITEDHGYNSESYVLLYPLARSDMDDHLDTISKYNEIQAANVDRTQWQPHEGAHRLLTYLPCLAQAVIYLHTLEQPIKHRDIKPANILIDKDDGVMLADFDISRQYQQHQRRASMGPTELTIDYAPTHVQHPERPRDLEWDVISLAFVFAEMLSVALGETRHDMYRALRHGGVNNQPQAKENRDRPVFAEALRTGRLDTWLEYLTTIPRRSPQQVPLPDLDEDALKKVVGHISAMMNCAPQSGIKATRVLDDAYQHFSQLVEPCRYCGPDSGHQHRIVDVSDMSDSVSNASDDSDSDNSSSGSSEQSSDSTSSDHSISTASSDSISTPTMAYSNLTQTQNIKGSVWEPNLTVPRAMRWDIVSGPSEFQQFMGTLEQAGRPSNVDDLGPAKGQPPKDSSQPEKSLGASTHSNSYLLTPRSSTANVASNSNSAQIVPGTLDNEQAIKNVLAAFVQIKALGTEKAQEWRLDAIDSEIRFRGWAAGFAQYKDHGSTEIHTRLSRSLLQLLQTLNEVRAILSGERDGFLLVDESTTDISKSEIGELMLGVEDAITSLVRTTMLMRSYMAGGGTTS